MVTVQNVQQNITIVTMNQWKESSTSMRCLQVPSTYKPPHTVFEVELMKQLAMQLTFSACTFESQAAVYNSVHGPEDQVRLRDFTSNF